MHQCLSFWAADGTMVHHLHHHGTMASFTYLLLTLLLSSWRPFLSKSSAHTVPEEVLVHTGFSSLTVLAATSNMVTGVHRLNIISRYCMVLLWLLDWGQELLPCRFSRTGSGHCAGIIMASTSWAAAGGQPYPDCHQTPKAPHPPQRQRITGTFCFSAQRPENRV